jgi:hypothetical protein
MQSNPYLLILAVILVVIAGYLVIFEANKK